MALDLVKTYVESGLDILGIEKKYYFANKYSPKKLPEQRIRRDKVTFVYSWTHYAPQAWYDHLKKLEDDLKTAEERKQNAALVKKCSFCTAPESDLRKHKVCSACKSAFYCTTDCQKYDWSKKHKAECKELAAKAAAKIKKQGITLNAL